MARVRFNAGQTGLQTQATAERISAATVLTGRGPPILSDPPPEPVPLRRRIGS